MKILQINTVYGKGSTGKIARDIHDICVSSGIGCLTAYRCRDDGDPECPDTVCISTRTDSRIHGFLARLTMLKGFFSFFHTAAFLRRVRKYSPDVIHLHNLHGSYVNLPLLFGYIKRHDIPVVWTLHDCWAFTAICPHFMLSGCERWKTGCGRCPVRRVYSLSPTDNTRFVWNKKRKWFTGIGTAVVVTPSEWLRKLAGKSFLGCYPTVTVNNGIDLDVFKYTPSDIRKKYGLEGKKTVLGVSFGWSFRKGLDVMIKLAGELPEGYAVVLVGTDAEVDKSLPRGVISIPRTADRHELAEIYSAADVFVNPTREDNLPTVNIEALACGTPVVTFATGGSAECIDGTCGVAVDTGDMASMLRETVRICEEHPYTREACRARAAHFDRRERLGKYIGIYNDLIEKSPAAIRKK